MAERRNTTPDLTNYRHMFYDRCCNLVRKLCGLKIKDKALAVQLCPV